MIAWPLRECTFGCDLMFGLTVSRYGASSTSTPRSNVHPLVEPFLLRWVLESLALPEE